MRARVGQGEQPREMQTQRAAEAEQPEKDRGGAADPAASEVARLRIPEEFFEECVGHLRSFLLCGCCLWITALRLSMSLRIVIGGMFGGL